MKPKNLNTICIVCDKELDFYENDNCENALVIPNIQNAVVFRSSGQYGSTVHDFGSGLYPPPGWEKDVQIIVCDECMIKKAKIINTIRNKKTVPDEQVEYDSFEELRKLNATIEQVK